MKMPKIPDVKIPKIKLPSKEQFKRALPIIFGGLSVIGNAISTYMFVDTTTKATRIYDQMEADGKSKEDIRKEILPMYTKPALMFGAANACTIGAVVSAEAQIGGLVTGLAVADARRKIEPKDEDYFKNVDISMLPECGPEEVLFYDEYLDTGKLDGYFTLSEVDWWKAYAKFQEKFNSFEFCGNPSYADFYELLPKKKMFKEHLKSLGEWPNYATWDISENCSTEIMTIDVVPIDDTLVCNYVRWIITPKVSEEAIRCGLV